MPAAPGQRCAPTTALLIGQLREAWLRNVARDVQGQITALEGDIREARQALTAAQADLDTAKRNEAEARRV